MAYVYYIPISVQHSATDTVPQPEESLEYRALGLLAKLVVGYVTVCIFVGWLSIYLYFAFFLDDAADELNNFPAIYVSFYITISAFHNNGLLVSAGSLSNFQDHPFVLLIVGLLILSGNTCFPIFLRGVVVVLEWGMRRWEGTRSAPTGEQGSEKNFSGDRGPGQSGPSNQDDVLLSGVAANSARNQSLLESGQFSSLSAASSVVNGSSRSSCFPTTSTEFSFLLRGSTEDTGKVAASPDCM